MLLDNFFPKVSIIIPVYNGANYLENAINCALAQTYENVEVIVVNDGSTDDGATERIACSFGDRITYYCKENGGVSSALNFGISKMTGDYFSWLSHDDAYTPTKVADAVEALKHTPGTNNRTVSYSWGYYIDKDGTKVKPFRRALTENQLYTGEEVVLYMLEHSVLNGCCMLIPKCAFQECGLFDETLRYSQDMLMWYTLFFNGFSLVFDGKPNVQYRLHPAQTSQNRHDLFEHDAVCIAKRLVQFLKDGSNQDNRLLYLSVQRWERCSSEYT